MREIMLGFPLREAMFIEDLDRSNVVAHALAARLGLEVGDTGVGFGQRDINLVLRPDQDLDQVQQQVREELARQGLHGVSVSTAEWEPEEDDPDAEEADASIVRAKWRMDGAVTLHEAAEKLRGYAEELEQMAREGWELESPITDDYGFVRRTP